MTVMTPPDRSLEQRRAAIVKANEVRAARKNLKADLVAGNVNVLRILQDPPQYAETMKIRDLLMAVPKLGRVKVDKILSVAQVSPSKTLAGLTLRQRWALAGALNAFPVWRGVDGRFRSAA